MFVKETTGPDAGPDAAATRRKRRRRRSEDDGASASVAGAPPAALLTLFAHVPASAFARRVAVGNAGTRNGCSEMA